METTATATTTAQHLVNESSLRGMLRAEDLLVQSISRSGLMGSVALAAALWVQDAVLLPSVDDEGRVDWLALRKRVLSLQADGSPVARAVAQEVPETIVMDKGKRRYLNEVKRGKGEKDKKPAPKKTKSATESSSSSSNKKEWKRAATAAVSSLKAGENDDGDDDREPLEIIEDEDDYD